MIKISFIEPIKVLNLFFKHIFPKRLHLWGKICHDDDMLNIQNYIIFILAFFFAVQAFAKVPEVRTETREENGKKINYMFIDGVKVHETDPAESKFPPGG